MAFSIEKFNSPPSNHSRPQLESSVDQFKQKILVQNRALARKNSVLMTKISDLESKVSELIQHNIELRALNAKNEDQKRKWFAEKLNVIEEGVSQRFEEMFQMFSVIRANEGLPASKLKPQDVIDSAAQDTSGSDKTVSFQNIKSPRNNARSERRRKSLRRQSIYVAPSSPPPLKEGDELEEVVRDGESHINTLVPENQLEDDDGEIHIHFDASNPFEEIPHSQQDFNKSLNEFLIPEETEEVEVMQEVVNVDEAAEIEEVTQEDQEDFDNAISLSPIKFSSPRVEKPDDLKKSKFAVYEDSPTPEFEDFNAKIEKLASGSVLKEEKELHKDILAELNDEVNDELSQRSLVHDIEKIKHTKSKKQKPRSSSDEQMPESIADEVSTRKSRTRGKQVSYAEPSLRVKMRRQLEKFVDAVVEDAFIGIGAPMTIKIEEKSFEREQEESKEEDNDERSSTSHSGESKITQQPQSQQDNDIYIEASRVSPIQQKPKPLIEQDSLNITKRRKLVSVLNQNKIQKKDSKPMSKLEIEDESELSVFDLVEESAVGVPKTYKGKPEIITKRRNSRRHSTAT